MATAANIIERSMKLLGQLEAGGTPTSDEYADGLAALNAMLDSWRNERLMVYAMQDETLTLADGDSSYTIGTGGDLNTTRPIAIERAYIVEDSISYDVNPMTEGEYAAIDDKTTEADFPEWFLYRPTMATATLILWPVPNATRTLKLVTRVVVGAFASTATTVTLPPGWEQALATNLAVQWAPEFETSASEDVKRMARESKAGIKSANRQPIKINTGLVSLLGSTRGNILAGQ